MYVEDTLFEVEYDSSMIAAAVLSETPDEFTLYQLAGYVNEALRRAGVEKTVRPQMMYNYAKSGMVVKNVKDSKIRVTRDQAQEFITRYVDRQIKK